MKTTKNKEVYLILVIKLDQMQHFISLPPILELHKQMHSLGLKLLFFWGKQNTYVKLDTILYTLFLPPNERTVSRKKQNKTTTNFLLPYVIKFLIQVHW